MGVYIKKENEFEEFCSKHNERQIYPMQKILQKYPALRLYGFKTAMKEWTEHHFCEWDIYEDDPNRHFSKSIFYPSFLPDLYLVTDEVILLFEIEDYSPMTKEKMNRIYKWCTICDMKFEPEIIIYGSDRFGNFQRIINSFINTEEECLEWLLELQNTPNYKNQDLKKLIKDKDKGDFRSYNDDNIGYCKFTNSSDNSQIKEYSTPKQTTEGSIYY